jgi:DNA-binding NarL/FixJ family response regulator
VSRASSQALAACPVAAERQARPRHSVLVVHSQTVFAEVLAQRLGQQPELDVVGAVSRPARALALVPSWSVKTVVLEWALPDGAAPELAAGLQALDDPPGLVVLGDGGKPGTVINALRAGARAWVPQDSSVEQLVEALRRTSHGESWLPGGVLGGVLGQLLAQQRSAESCVLDVLTERERDVLRCMVAGMDQAAIAAYLYLSPNTVRTHRRRTLAKLGVHSSLEAVFVARRAGLNASTSR